MTIKTPEAYRLEALKFFGNMAVTNLTRYNSFAGAVATGIMNMGAALHTEEAPAMVSLRRGESDISRYRLHIDPNAFSEFTVEQRAGVVWHELNHVIFCHLDNESAVKQGMDNAKMCTIAEEIVCNDAVLHHGVDLPHMSPDSPEGIYYGEKFLGFNTFPRSTKEVYDLLDEQKDDNDMLRQALNSEDEQGCPGQVYSDAQDGSESDSQGGSGTGDQEEAKEALEALLDGMKGNFADVAKEKSPSTGDGGNGSSEGDGGEGHSYNLGYDEDDMPVDWAEFLWRVNPRVDIRSAFDYGMSALSRSRSDWRRQPLYTYGLSTNGAMLPSRRPAFDPQGDGNDVKPTVVVAVDQSGSLGRDLAEKVMGMAAHIPGDVADVKIVVYASKAAIIDMEGKEPDEMMEEAGKHQIGYGTSFDNIYLELAKAETDFTNTTVINFTDGECEFNNTPDEIIKNWVMVDVNTKSSSDEPFTSFFSSSTYWKKTIPKDNLYTIQDCAPGFSLR